MNRDPKILTATTIVKRVNAGTAGPDGQLHCAGTMPDLLTVSGASDLPGTQYQWQFSHDNLTCIDISGATSPSYQSPPSLQHCWTLRI
jgi:hypothetical protein